MALTDRQPLDAFSKMLEDAYRPTIYEEQRKIIEGEGWWGIYSLERRQEMFPNLFGLEPAPPAHLAFPHG